MATNEEKIESDCDYCRYPAGGSSCCGDEEPVWSCYMETDPRMEDYDYDYDNKPCPCFAPRIIDEYDLIPGKYYDDLYRDYCESV